MNYEKKIWKAYPLKIDEIAEYLSKDEGIRTMYGNPTKEEIAMKLNEPTLQVFGDCGQLSYCNHSFDGTHIIGLEFEGVLEEFSYVSIDG